MSETKKCTQCLEEKPLDEYYSRLVKRKTKDDYIYYHPNCKECVKENSWKWARENPRRNIENRKRYDNSEKRSKSKKESNKKRRLAGKEKEWRNKNKDKLREYGEKYSNKKHTISEKEWIRCKEYFGFNCAYCGVSEKVHKKKFKQQLHKEHVIHEGRDDIKNCVPSCKTCNSSKHTAALNQWYSHTNPVYSRERYLKIYQWLRYDCKD